MTDRELDALIAEKVFGYVRGAAMCRGEMVVVLTPSVHRLYTSHTRSQSDPGSWQIQPQLTVTDMRLVPKFSTDIAAAFQVVDKLMVDNFMVSVNCSHENGWWCVVYPPEGMQIESDHFPCAAKAICAAALGALGIEVES